MAISCKLCAADSLPIYTIQQGSTRCKLHECRQCGFRFTDFFDRLEDAEPATEANLEALRTYVATGLEANKQRVVENIELVTAAVSSGTLLDVGCGAGGFLAALSGFTKTGIELEPTRAEFCRRQGLNVVERPLEDPCWEDRSFDVITLWDVIEHVNDPLSMTTRAHALLKQGGRLFMDTPTRDGFLYVFGDWTARMSRGHLLGTMGVQYAATQFGHKQIFRKEDMRRMLTSSGFARVRIDEKFELSFPVDFYTRRFIKPGLLRRVANPLASALLAVLPVRNKMIVMATRD